MQYELTTFMFYACVIPAFCWEVFVLLYPRKCFNYIKLMGEVAPAQMTDSQVNLQNLFSGYGAWVIVGFWGSQWFLFVIISAIYAIRIRRHIVGMYIESIINAVILVAILFNRFHWHYDCVQFFKNLYHVINPY